VRSLRYLNKYFYKYRVRLLWGVLFIALSNILMVYPAVMLRKGVDYAISQYERSIGPAGAEPAQDDVTMQLLLYSGIIIGLVLLGGFFMFLMRQTIIVMSRLIEYDLKNDIYAHYQKLDVSFYKRNNTGDLMNRISEDVSRVRMYIGPAIMYLVNTVVTVATVFFFMTSVNWKLTLYVLAPLPVLSIAIYYVSELINRRSNAVQAQLSRLSTAAQETFSGVRVLKAFSRESAAAEEFTRQSNDYKEKNLALVKTEALFMPFMVLMIGLSIIITIYIGGREAIAGNITIGNIPEFVLYVYKLTWPFASLGWVTSLIQRAAASQDRINEFLHTEPSIESPPVAPQEIQGEVEFRDVSFVYPDSGIRALDHVSFRIKPGQSLAIIGRTGSGKSTIASLICRLYDVSEGEVLIDGKNVKSINLYSLRSQTGYVPQEVFLFSETIYNNIAFSVSDARDLPDRRGQVEQAAKDAAIYSNIIGFPDKFGTMVGERGITLSGGQKQRISIARAIIKSPRILIFDDCLSAVDTETEEEILGNLRRIMKGRTSVIISHRVSSVKTADHIIVLDQGRIIERGTHNELLDAKGQYYELHRMQLLEAEKKD
jgi:ATP-binding cassette, subfamily B, multidrug efflux pump